jgi:hypothetical protein
VWVETRAGRRTLALGAGEGAVVDVPRGRTRLEPVRIRVDRGFRPSDVDPRARDSRWLGCRVTFEAG